MERKTAIGIRGARKKMTVSTQSFLALEQMWTGAIAWGRVLPRGQGEERREGQHAVYGNIQGGPCSFSGA